MKRALIIAAMTAALATPALGYTPLECRGLFCTPQTLGPDARIQNLPEITDPNVTDSDRVLWVERCKPRKVFDGLTVRWAYAERGCAVGPMHLE